MANEIEREDCIKGIITNSDITSMDFCAINYSRQVLELRLFSEKRVVSRSQATFEPVSIVQVSRNTIKIIIGNQIVKIRSRNKKRVLLNFDRPFRGGELGFPHHQGVFYPYTSSRNGLWGLLESVCLGKSSYDVTNVKGLSAKAFREISSFARTRFAFYKGNCKLAPLYELAPDEKF